MREVKGRSINVTPKKFSKLISCKSSSSFTLSKWLLSLFYRIPKTNSIVEQSKGGTISSTHSPHHRMRLTSFFHTFYITYKKEQLYFTKTWGDDDDEVNVCLSCGSSSLCSQANCPVDNAYCSLPKADVLPIYSHQFPDFHPCQHSLCQIALQMGRGRKISVTVILLKLQISNNSTTTDIILRDG